MAKVLRGQGALFEPRFDTGTWKPPQELPSLKGQERVWFDTEYEAGRHKCDSDLAGISIATTDKKYYLPVNHKEGGNLDPDKVRYWAKQELRNKTMVNIATGLDAEVLRKYGIDLEGQGCRLHDVSHAAALINENQFKGMNLDEVGEAYVGRRKAEIPLAKERIHEVHSSLVGPYAEDDAALVRDIDLAQLPMLEKDGLNRVMRVEDDLIWVNNHIERQGARLDMPKLAGWRVKMAEEYADLAMGIWERTGVKLKPSAAASWDKLYSALKLKKPEYEKTRDKKHGMLPITMEYVPEGFTEAFLKRESNELVKAGLRMRRMESLRTKYTDKYWKMQRDGRLMFNLHQLRASEDDYGTVVGRYSSSNPNIQQVFKVENQEKRFGDIGYIIRELMVPDDGYDLFAVDGSQLQFRLFAHYSDDAGLISTYNNRPDVDFHQMVADLFGLDRQSAKHNNFAMVLGMGREKLAVRLDLACECQDTAWWSKSARVSCRSYEEKRTHIFGINDNHSSACPARKSNDLGDQYEREFPAARLLMERVMETAEKRGYIASLLGRRRRFHEGDKFYSGLASLLQMSEADMVKSKMVTLYRERRVIGIHCMRMPVHDETTGDIEKDAAARARLEECCAEVELKLKVPMIWDAKYGHNWRFMYKNKEWSTNVN